MSEVFNNIQFIAQTDERGNYTETYEGCRIEESDAGSFFVSKIKVFEDGEVKERKYVLPAGMTAEEYVKIERLPLGKKVTEMLTIKEALRAMANECTELSTKALEFYSTPIGYAKSVALNWSRNQFVNFVLREERA